MDDQEIADRISANLANARNAAVAEGATETQRHLDKLTLSLTRGYRAAVDELGAEIEWDDLPCNQEGQANRGGGPKPPAPDSADDVTGDEPDAE